MQFVSPRQLARAAGVSESSIKRWCDLGQLPSTKTRGGHRRLPLDAAAEFLRQVGKETKPELLGLPPRIGPARGNRRSAVDDLYLALLAGDEAACCQMLFDLHLAGEPASRIFDEVVAEAFHRIGAGWKRDEVHVYQERRACTICLRVLDAVKAVIPRSKTNAPYALGGAPEFDPYMLPTAMVEIVLRQRGWQAQSLGSQLPFTTLVSAIRDLRPQLFWLSVSHIDNEQLFLKEYTAFYSQIHGDVAVVVGGRALTESIRRQMTYSAYCDNLQHLEAFVTTLQRSSTAEAPAGGNVESPAVRPRRRGDTKT
jgi:MerR family transcriptional regulator, light-induced transcriptional regulator